MKQRLIDANAFKEYLRKGTEENADIIPQRLADAVLDIMDGIMLDIDEQPTVDSAPKWIPCEERLPDDGKDVLISYRYKEGEGDTSHVYIDITSYGRIWANNNGVEHKDWRAPFQYFYSNYEVIAWMPLPEPYEGERRDDDKQ